MRKPGFFRHLAIIAYDALLLLALLFLATAVVLPLNQGEAFSSRQFIYPAFLLVISFLFYGWFWTHGGQTLGMKAWKVKVLTLDHQPITWLHAFKRFTAAIPSWLLLGLGFIWQMIDKKKYCWHDRLSKTALFMESR